MKIDLIISADDIKKEKVENKVVVVIDMLRATSVITTAIQNGCKEVIPVLTIEEALEIARKNREQYILGGERKALKIEGFDCANSPLEYESQIVKGKTVIMTTTNGTRAIKGSEGASHILVGAMINAAAVVDRVIEIGQDVTIVNAGTNGQLSIDDLLCSGYIIDMLMRKVEAELSDVAIVARYVYSNNQDIRSFIKNANHYKRIMELGLGKDLEYCCQKDIFHIVPEYKDGAIRL